MRKSLKPRLAPPSSFPQSKIWPSGFSRPRRLSLGGCAQLLALTLIISVHSWQTFAFVRASNSPRWHTLPVPYKIHSLGLPSSANGGEFAAIQEAFETWQNIPSSAISFSYEGTSDIGSGGNDGVNVVSFRDTAYPFGSSTIAVTLSTTAPGQFLDADILFNPNLTFSTSGKSDAFDIQAIATHEIGHFLGLDHTAILSATMTPTGARGSVFPRILQSDDIIGASVIYPEVSFLSSAGGFSGRITNKGTGVFGAHVVVIDSEGRAIVSALSELDGTYQISGLAPGSYSVYAEPLDGPVTEDEIGGQFDSKVNLDFTTTFLGNTLDLSSNQTITVAAGQTRTNVDIAVLPPPSGPLNLTSPALGVTAAQGVSGSFTVRGAGLSPGTQFFIQGMGITFGPATLPASDSARLPVSISADAPLGSRTLFARAGGGLTALTGGFVVTAPPPQVSSVSPNSGTNEGGTRVTIHGLNFVRGSSVSLSGMPLSDLVYLNPTTLEGTTPPNTAGSLNVLVVNPDGTSAVLEAAFDSLAAPPVVGSVSPISGPPTTVVTITGSHFDRIPSNNVVRFNNVPASVASSSGTQLVVIVPIGASTGPVTVSVFGQPAAGPLFTVTALVPSQNHAEAQFQYIDASVSSGGTQLNFSEAEGTNDDFALQIALPFNFTLFTSTYLKGAKISVATNGWVSMNNFVPNPAEWQNAPLPRNTVPHDPAAGGGTGTIPSSLVAPFFDDLVLQRPGSGVFTRLLGSTPNQRFVIEWKDVNSVDEQGEVIDNRIGFQLVFFEGSNDIAFQYQTLEGPRSHGDSATVGIQDSNREQAVQFSSNQPRLSPGKIVIFRFNPSNGTYALSTNETRQFIPWVIDTDEFRTNLGLTNISILDATATLTLYDENGMSVASRTVFVPAGSLTQLNNVIRYLRGNNPSQVSNLFGSLVVRADQSVVAFATQIDNVSNDPSLESGKASGKTSLLVPSTTSVNPFRSSLIIQNVGTEASTIDLRQRDFSGVLKKELSVTIPPNGLFHTEDIHAALGLSGVFGPLEIVSTNSVPVVAASRVYSSGSRTSGYFEGVDISEASATEVIPVSQDTSSFRSNLGINNPGETEALVDVSLFDRSGALLGSQHVTVPAHGLLQINNVNRFITGANGMSNSLGYIRMTANHPVLGFSSLISNSSDDPGLAPSLAAGASRLLIPSSTNVNQFRSSLTLINLDAVNAALVQVAVRDASGSIIGSTDSLMIEPGGIFQVDDFLTSLAISSNFGPIEISSPNNIPLAAVSRVYSLNDSTSGFFVGQSY